MRDPLERATIWRARSPSGWHAAASGPYLLVAPFVFRVDTELATILDPLEAAHAAWAPLSYLRDVNHHRLRSVPGVPPEILFPAVEMEGAPLWGFTYRLVSDWLGLPATGRPADDVLRFLLERGLTLVSDWNGRRRRGARRKFRRKTCWRDSAAPVRRYWRSIASKRGRISCACQGPNSRSS